MMFTFPAMDFMTAPVATAGGSIDFTMIGAIFAWMLIAALVGTLLGMLRESTSPHPKASEDTALADTRLHADHIHSEAA